MDQRTNQPTGFWHICQAELNQLKMALFALLSNIVILTPISQTNFRLPWRLLEKNRNFTVYIIFCNNFVYLLNFFYLFSFYSLTLSFN